MIGLMVVRKRRRYGRMGVLIDEEFLESVCNTL